MSVAAIGRLTAVIILSVLLPAPSSAQARGAARGSSGTAGSRAANSFTTGRVIGTTVDRREAVARIGRDDSGSAVRNPARWYGPRVVSGYRYATAAVSAAGRYDARPASRRSTAAYPGMSGPSVDDPDAGSTGRTALSRKPGGIFAADGSPLAATPAVARTGPDVDSPADAGSATAVYRVRLPAAARPHGFRLADIVPVVVWEPVRCAATDQDQARTRKLPRVIGWLYRWVRGYDLERSTTPAPLLYMRSPLLAGFNGPVDCTGDATARDYHAPTCVAVTASDGHEHLATYFVPLQMGATTPAELANALRRRLKAGEHVQLRTIAGRVVELDPAKAQEIDVKKCDPEDE